MSNSRKEAPPKGALELMEEVFYLLRNAPPRVFASYCFGTLPFIFGLLYFWADMSKNSFAYTHVVRGSFLVAVLFIWMKCWHVVYARYLWAEVCDEHSFHWSPGRILRLFVRQAIIQPSGLFLLPAALIAVLPFGWAYAFYQNATVLEDGKSTEITSFLRQAGRFARPWQLQNSLIIWALSPYLMVIAAAFFLVVSPVLQALTASYSSVFLGLSSVILVLVLIPLSPFGIIIGVNIAAAVSLLPSLFHILTGIETRFTLGFGGLFHTTFFATVCGLTYLCMDPLMKAAYVLRNFYMDAHETGEDLQVELRRATGKAATMGILVTILVGIACGLSNRAFAQEGKELSAPDRVQAVSPSDLNRALDDELQSWRYAWRMPRISPEEKETRVSAAFVREIAETLADWGEAILRRTQPLVRMVEDFIDWLRDRTPEFKRGEGRKLEEISPILKAVTYCLLAILLVAVGVVAWRSWRNRNKESLHVDARVVTAKPDIEEETTTAAELPEDGWLALAKELIERGELRLGLRALFLATLAFLARCDLVHIARFKSNSDYRRELERRSHARPGMLDAFAGSTAIYEAVWYGMHEATNESIQHLRANQEKLRAYEIDS